MGPLARIGRDRSPAYRWLVVGLGAMVLISVVRVVTDAPGLDSAGTIHAAILATCPDPDGRHRRPLERARGCRQHRPRGADDPRDLGCRLLHLLLRPVGRDPRGGHDGRRGRAAPCHRDRHVRGRPHRLRGGDQPDRPRHRRVPGGRVLPRPRGRWGQAAHRPGVAGAVHRARPVRRRSQPGRPALVRRIRPRRRRRGGHDGPVLVRPPDRGPRRRYGLAVVAHGVRASSAFMR